MTTKYARGLGGERIAEKYLESLGYKILERRFKTRYGEIDIIACSEIHKELLFLEIKSRNRNSIAIKNMEIVTHRQMRRCSEAANYFLVLHEIYSDYKCQFDLIIVVSGKVFSHIKNAWGEI